ncbi:MAG TPA: TetR/AcrR family transcriptional regulator [Acidimicrobiales bacterium]|nr:TetR/AcrR family transcriptional regulator [Acidimicrobiales bacterium]
MTQTASPSPEEQSLIDAISDPGPGVDVLHQIDPLGEDPDPDRPVPSNGDETLPPAAASKADTRERILDVALDLFSDQGYDGTSLREIADRLDVTKAALYYHFESKDDILLALHMRLHEFGREALLKMAEQEPVTLKQWGELLDEVVDAMLAQRKLFLMHERNQAALEKLHRADHDAEHEDLQNQFRRVLADTRIPLEDRVRMAASFGVLFSGLFLSGEAFSSSTNEELGSLLRRILHDVLGG